MSCTATKENGETPSKEPLNDMDWKKSASYLALICGLDIAIHGQIASESFLGSDEASQKRSPESQSCFQLLPSHFPTARILFYSALLRMLPLLACFILCQRKSIPKFIQPYTHYITMTTTYIFCSITMWRLLLDSEPPSTVSYFAYLFLILIDVLFITSEYIFSRYVIKNSGAVTKLDDTENQKGKKKSDKDDKDEKEERSVPFLVMVRKLSAWYKSEWRAITVGFCFLIIGITASSVESLLNSRIIDAINSENPMDLIPSAVLMFTVCQLVERVAISVRDYLVEIVGSRVSLKAKSKLYETIVKQEVGFFDQTKSGKLLRRIGTFSSDMEQLWYSSERNIRTILHLVGSTIAMITMSWRLSVIIVMGIYVLWLPNNMLKNFYMKRWRKVEKVATECSSMASEAIRNIKTVKSFVNEDVESTKYEKKLTAYHKLCNDNQLVEPVLSTFGTISWLVVRATVLLYGGHLLINQQLTPGKLVTFLLYMGNVWNNFRFLVDWGAHRFWKMLINMETFFEYIEREPQVAIAGKITSNKLLGKIEFKDVSFHYPSRPESKVLKNISFTVEAGDVVALVGSSGGGKSTCVGLLERFYDPTTGIITLDGESLQNYNHKFLHEQMSIVSQEPVLFGCSIEDNIKYGKPDATHEEVVRAAKDANAHDFITALDDGYDTDVGEAGSQMSGGQKQRIAIARALITNPKIMLLDEATSALDAESESLVQEALQNSMKGRTVVIIAHRLSTVEHADKIVVIDKGNVVEEGTHQGLVSSKGVYSKLVRRQLKKAKPMAIEELMKENDEDSLSDDSGIHSQRES